jgi:hypothetical protein
MALGDVVAISPDSGSIEILATAVAANGAPSGTNGVSANDVRAVVGCLPRKMRAVVVSTAGSGVMTATMKLWIRMGAAGWVVAKALNAGAAIAETGADTIGYSEEVDVLDGADRFYMEIAAIAGTSTSVKGLLIVSRPTAP